MDMDAMSFFEKSFWWKISYIYPPPSPILSPEKAKIKTKQNTHVSKKHLITCNKLQELPVKNF